MREVLRPRPPGFRFASSGLRWLAIDALRTSAHPMALGYIIREKVGRNNRYILREKVLITDETGKPAGQATWDYLPDGVRAAVADLKNVLMSGSFADAKIVHIDNLPLQVVVINAESGSTQNVMSSGEMVNNNGKKF